MKTRRISLRMVASKFFANRADCAGKVMANRAGGAQALHRIPAFRDRRPGLLDHGLQRSVGLSRTVREQVGYRGKLQQHSLETLQQGIVQLSSDPRPLA